ISSQALRFPKEKSLELLACHLPRDLISAAVSQKIAPENIIVTWITLNQPYADDVPLLLRPHHLFYPDVLGQADNPPFFNKLVRIGIFNPDPSFTYLGANKGSWNVNLGGSPHQLSQFEIVAHNAVASPDNIHIEGLTGKRGSVTHSFWTLTIFDNQAHATLHSMVNDDDQSILTQISKNPQKIRELPNLLTSSNFGGTLNNIHLSAIKTLFFGRELYSFNISIPRGTKPFLLSDGSEIAISGDENIWVKQPGQAYYSTPWQDYSIVANLDYKFAIIAPEDNVDSLAHLYVPRGTRPFLLPDGSEVATSGDESIWVKQPGQAYYATPWEQYAADKKLKLKIIIQHKL
ncbi:MAG TPA: hypothetical protein DEP85_08685, partial [Holosporales bacterium]|nr:hypothetical protein [Holosporales bacterium]